MAKIKFEIKYEVKEKLYALKHKLAREEREKNANYCQRQNSLRRG